MPTPANSRCSRLLVFMRKRVGKVSFFSVPHSHALMTCRSSIGAMRVRIGIGDQPNTV